MAFWWLAVVYVGFFKVVDATSPRDATLLFFVINSLIFVLRGIGIAKIPTAWLVILAACVLQGLIFLVLACIYERYSDNLVSSVTIMVIGAVLVFGIGYVAPALLPAFFY